MTQAQELLEFLNDPRNYLKFNGSDDLASQFAEKSPQRWLKRQLRRLLGIRDTSDLNWFVSYLDVAKTPELLKMISDRPELFTPVVRRPGAIYLHVYYTKLGQFTGAMSTDAWEIFKLRNGVTPYAQYIDTKILWSPLEEHKHV